MAIETTYDASSLAAKSRAERIAETPRDVIARAMEARRADFASKLESLALEHMEANVKMRDAVAKGVALRLGRACADAARAAIRSDVDSIMAGGMDSWLSAFNVAARLLGMTQAERAASIARA